MKKILSESPLVIIADQEYDCTIAKDKAIVTSALESVNSEKRRNEILYTRSLLFQELNIDELEKDSIGRPTLPKGDVSISHSGKFYGICYHPDKNVGFDIEIVSDKPARIKHKFQNELEADFSTSDVEITRLWTLKEAVYKYLSRPGILFAEQIHISKNREQYLAKYMVDNKVIEEIFLESLIYNGHIISYTI